MLTFDHDLFHMGSQHDSPTVLLDASSQCIDYAFGSPHWVVNGAPCSVSLHQHESHFCTDGVLGQHTTAIRTALHVMSKVTVCYAPSA